jgi:hypothetical protein
MMQAFTPFLPISALLCLGVSLCVEVTCILLWLFILRKNIEQLTQLSIVAIILMAVAAALVGVTSWLLIKVGSKLLWIKVGDKPWVPGEEAIQFEPWMRSLQYLIMALTTSLDVSGRIFCISTFLTLNVAYLDRNLSQAIGINRQIHTISFQVLHIAFSKVCHCPPCGMDSTDKNRRTQT